MRYEWNCRYSPILENRISNVCLSLSHWYPGSGVVLDCNDSWSLHPYLLWHENYAFSHSPNGCIFRTIWHSWKSVMGCKVGQISSQTNYVSVEIWYEKACITEFLFLEAILPDDISTPHTETWPVMRMHRRMRMRIYRQTYMRTNHYINI